MYTQVVGRLPRRLIGCRPDAPPVPPPVGVHRGPGGHADRRGPPSGQWRPAARRHALAWPRGLGRPNGGVVTAIRTRGWWVLVFFAVTLALFGAMDLTSGVTADPAIPQALVGRTPAEVQAEDPTGYRLYDFVGARHGGQLLIVMGTLLVAIIVIPYRAGQRWAWRLLGSCPSGRPACLCCISRSGPRQSAARAADDLGPDLRRRRRSRASRRSRAVQLSAAERVVAPGAELRLRPGPSRQAHSRSRGPTPRSPPTRGSRPRGGSSSGGRQAQKPLGHRLRGIVRVVRAEKDPVVTRVDCRRQFGDLPMATAARSRLRTQGDRQRVGRVGLLRRARQRAAAEHPDRPLGEGRLVALEVCGRLLEPAPRGTRRCRSHGHRRCPDPRGRRRRRGRRRSLRPAGHRRSAWRFRRRHRDD